MDIHNDYTNNGTFYFFKVCFFLFKLHPRNLGWNSGFPRTSQGEGLCSAAPWTSCMKSCQSPWRISYFTEQPIFPSSSAVWMSGFNRFKRCEKCGRDISLCFHEPAKWFPSRLKCEAHCFTAHCLSDNDHIVTFMWQSHWAMVLSCSGWNEPRFCCES